MNPIGQVIDLVLRAFLALLLIRLVVEWIQYFARSWSPSGPVLVILETIYTITDPPIHAFRRVFKPLRIGGVMLDLSFLAVMLTCYLLLQVNAMVWAA